MRFGSIDVQRSLHMRASSALAMPAGWKRRAASGRCASACWLSLCALMVASARSHWKADVICCTVFDMHGGASDFFAELVAA